MTSVSALSSWQHQKRVAQPSFVSQLSCTPTDSSENALHWDIGACYQNLYPDMRHTLVAGILVISFVSARGSTAAKVHARKITRPEGTLNVSESCWRNSSIDSNSTSGTLMVFFYLAFRRMLDISLTFVTSRPFFATSAGGSPTQHFQPPRAFVCLRIRSRYFSLARQAGQAFSSDSGSSPLHMRQWADLLVKNLRASSM